MRNVEMGHPQRKENNQEDKSINADRLLWKSRVEFIKEYKNRADGGQTAK